MPLSVLFFVAALVAAAVMLALETWWSVVDGTPPLRGAVATGLFAVAAVGGTTLLLALSGQEWLMAATLAPLTALCILRFWHALAVVEQRWARVAVAAVLLVGGVAGGLAVTPTPLTRGDLRGASSETQTILPEAGRTVRG